MQKLFLMSIIMFVALGLSWGQDLAKELDQAKGLYGASKYVEAIQVLDNAGQKYATSYENKNALASVYNEIGEKEYQKKNYANAYDCFRKAVKIYPTHQAASNNFWQMKQNFDVANLRNEGTTSLVSTEKSEIQPETKLKEAETMLKELEKTHPVTTTQPTDELKRYQEELEKQKALIAELQRRFFQTPTTTTVVTADNTKTQQILDNLVKLYQVALTTNHGQPSDVDILAEQMKEYRTMLEKQQAFLESQQSGQQNLVIIAVVFAAGLAFVILVFLFILIMVARRRQKERFAYATNFDLGLGYGPVTPLTLEERTNRLLAYEPVEQNVTEEGKGEEKDEEDLTKYLIQAERLKQLQNEKKYGTIKWETLRKYLTELEKDLRSEILYAVETKINSGEIYDFSRVLPVLFHYLTDPDSYLRDKARDLITSNLKVEALEKEPLALLTYEDGKSKKDPLSLASLMRHVDKLQFMRTARREHCINTARYTRGMAIILNRFSPQEQDLLYKTALVHDIGYLLLDKDKLEELENKRDLSPEEVEFIHRHPQKGVEYFRNYNIPKEMEEGILYHHERNDGSGYPKCLTREAIPEFAKLIGIADAFDALTSNRSFREKMKVESALVIMKDMGRNKFEASYLEALITYLKKSGKLKG